MIVAVAWGAVIESFVVGVVAVEQLKVEVAVATAEVVAEFVVAFGPLTVADTLVVDLENLKDKSMIAVAYNCYHNYYYTHSYHYLNTQYY